VAYNATVPEASDLGLCGWTIDPATAIISGSFAAAVQYLAAVYYKPEFDTPPLPQRIFVPNVIVGSWTAMQLGLINMDQLGANNPGTVLAIDNNAVPVAGLNARALTYAAAAPPVLPQGRYWISLVVTGTTGTALAASNPGAGGLGLNVGTDAAHTRFGIALGTGILVAGANITPASNVQTVGAGLALCAALG
jgi:hypothetical protein